MKILMIDGFDKYLYPQEIKTLNEFMDYIKEHKNSFIELKKLDDENESELFFIKEDVKTTYVNFNNVTTIEETKVNIITNTEYDKKIRKIANSICEGCPINGASELGCDTIKNKRRHINLDDETCSLREDAEMMMDSYSDQLDDEPFNPNQITGKDDNILLFHNKKNKDN